MTVRKSTVRLVIPVLLAQLLALGALALDPTRSVNQYTTRAWSLEDGFPQTSANAIVQAPDGYIYVATFGGLIRFDGVRVTNIPSDGTCSNRLYSMEVDREGTIWVGTERSGLCRVEDGALVAFPAPDGRDVEGVTTIRQARRGGVWVGSVNGLAHVSERGFEWFDSIPGLPSPGATALDEAPDGTLWVGTAQGLCLLREGRCVVPEWVGELAHEPIEAIRHSKDGVTWVGTRTRLYRVSQGRSEEITIPRGHNRIRTLLVDRHGNAWMGLDPGGLRRVWPR